jgi:hypothetical protein
MGVTDGTDPDWMRWEKARVTILTSRMAKGHKTCIEDWEAFRNKNLTCTVQAKRKIGSGWSILV